MKVKSLKDFLEIKVSKSSSPQLIKDALNKGQSVFPFILSPGLLVYIGHCCHTSIRRSDELDNHQIHEGECWLLDKGGVFIKINHESSSKTISELLDLDIKQDKTCKRLISEKLSHFICTL